MDQVAPDANAWMVVPPEGAGNGEFGAIPQLGAAATREEVGAPAHNQIVAARHGEDDSAVENDFVDSLNDDADNEVMMWLARSASLLAFSHCREADARI